MTKILSVSKLYLALSVFIIVCFTSVFPSCSTANLSDVKICSSLTSSECNSDVSSLPGDVPVIYCSAILKNAPSNTKVTFEWKHDGESMGKAEVETESGVVKSTLRPNSTLEPGNYSVTLKIDADNVAPISKEFTIE